MKVKQNLKREPTKIYTVNIGTKQLSDNIHDQDKDTKWYTIDRYTRYIQADIYIYRDIYRYIFRFIILNQPNK